MKKKSNIDRESEMDCTTCGKVNEERMCVIMGAPTEECPFTMTGGKGMICLECYTKQESK